MQHLRKSETNSPVAQHTPFPKTGKKTSFHTKLLIGSAIIGTVVACSPATSGGIDKTESNRSQEEDIFGQLPTKYLLYRSDDGKYYVSRIGDGRRILVSHIGEKLSDIKDVDGHRLVLTDSRRGIYSCWKLTVGPEGAEVLVLFPGIVKWAQDIVITGEMLDKNCDSCSMIKSELALLGTDRIWGDETTVYSSPNHTDHYYAFMREDWKGVLWLHVKRTGENDYKDSRIVSVEKKVFLLPEGEKFCKPLEKWCDYSGNFLIATSSGIFRIMNGMSDFLKVSESGSFSPEKDWEASVGGGKISFRDMRTGRCIKFSVEFGEYDHTRLTGEYIISY